MKLVKWISPIAAVASIFKPKDPKLPAPIPTATRDDARAATSADDALRKRRGGAADILAGAGGMEAGAGTTGKAKLGQ